MSPNGNSRQSRRENAAVDGSEVTWRNRPMARDPRECGQQFLAGACRAGGQRSAVSLVRLGWQPRWRSLRVRLGWQPRWPPLARTRLARGPSARVLHLRPELEHGLGVHLADP